MMRQNSNKQRPKSTCSELADMELSRWRFFFFAFFCRAVQSPSVFLWSRPLRISEDFFWPPAQYSSSSISRHGPGLANRPWRCEADPLSSLDSSEVEFLVTIRYECPVTGKSSFWHLTTGMRDLLTRTSVTEGSSAGNPLGPLALPVTLVFVGDALAEQTELPLFFFLSGIQ